jgi:serine phosphatase RsbU (regulator of sigma subunit)
MNHEKMLSLKVEETEMEKTVDILNKFVPNSILIEEPVNIFGVSYPAKKTGGDYFNVVLKDDKILIAVADVCGKGYDAAVVTVVLSVINEMGAAGKLSGGLTEVEKYLNEYILNKNLDGRFVTAFFAIFDLKNYELEYLSLGHEPAILIHNNEKTLLESSYMPIGIMTENYESKKIKIKKGDNLFIYTDGIIEYIDYPELYEYILTNKSKKPDILINELYYMLVKDKEAQKDDFTSLMLNF